MQTARCSILLALAGCLDALDEPTATVDQDLNGDTWTVVDDNTHSGYGAENFGVDIANGGKVYVVGNRGEADGGSKWIVRTSTDGVSFSLDSTFSLAAGYNAIATHVAVKHGAGKVYVMGWAATATAVHWITRVAATSGGAFTTVDDVMLPAGTTITPVGLTIIDNGSLYVTANWGGVTHIRESIDGVTFTDGVLPYPNVVFDATCAVPLALLAVGHLDQPDHSSWYVTATVDAINWIQMDNFDTGSGTSYDATACTANGGDFYVGGTYQTATFRNWLVRKYANATATWSSVDVDASPGNGAPHAMGPGVNGRTYVAGALGGTSGYTTWHVRRAGSAGTTWVDSDDYVYNPTTSPQASARGYAYLASTGQTYVVGGSGIHGIVRKLQ
jgi:hypothetical protein